jgi:phage terminase small subunit
VAAQKPVPVPKGLAASGADLWRSIARQWAEDHLTPDARECRMLADACHEADVLAALSVELDAAMSEGRLIVKGSQGQPVTHPHVAEARRSRAQIAALLMKLGLEDPAASAKTPGVGMTTAEAGRLGGLARRRAHG